MEPENPGLLILGGSRPNGEASGGEQSHCHNERAGPPHHEVVRRAKHRTSLSSGWASICADGSNTSVWQTLLASSQTWTNGLATAYEPSTSNTGNGARRSIVSCAPGDFPSAQLRRSRPTAGAGGRTRQSSSTWPFPSATSTSWASPDWPCNFNFPNCPVRPRIPGGVAGVLGDHSRTLCRLSAVSLWKSWNATVILLRIVTSPVW